MPAKHRNHPGAGPGAGRLDELDVPLLRALASLLEHASVTASARALGRTQSSVSRTLARLRDIFDDPLLVAVGRTMRPTARAQALRAPVAQALAGVQRLFGPATPTAPHDERRVVRIAAADYAGVVVLHRWIAQLRRDAPGLEVRITAVDAGSIDPLARGELDLAIAPLVAGVGLEQFVARKLFDDVHVCVLRRDHPRARGKLSLKHYLALDHVMVGSVLPPVSAVDDALHRLGATRTIAARVPSVVSALDLVAVSDFAATSFLRAVPTFGARLAVRPLPFEVPPLELRLLWHPRETADPFHRWLREHLLHHAARLPRRTTLP